MGEEGTALSGVVPADAEKQVSCQWRPLDSTICFERPICAGVAVRNADRAIGSQKIVSL
jgi:hypothetical protein